MPFDTEPKFGQMGTERLVNGTMHAYVDVDRTTVRLRILNASNARASTTSGSRTNASSR